MFDPMTEVQKAAVALSLHKAGVQQLPTCYTDDEKQVTSEDGESTWWEPIIDGYLLWTSKTSPGWGEWVEVRVSENMQFFYVVADEYQPWGTGMDVSWRVATYPATNLLDAVRHAIKVSQSEFSLDGLIENEDTGRYERYVRKPQIALDA